MPAYYLDPRPQYEEFVRPDKRAGTIVVYAPDGSQLDYLQWQGDSVFDRQAALTDLAVNYPDAVRVVT